MSREGLPVHARRPAVRPAERVGVGEDVVAPHLVVQDMEPSGRLLLGRDVQRPLEPPNLVGSCQAHANLPLLGSFERTPNQGPFPPPALPGFLGTMSPSDACRARPSAGPLARSPRQCRQASRVASPRVRTCCAHYPGEPIDLRLSVHPVDRSGLRPWRGDSALASDLSRPAQASLALRPVRLLTRQSGPLSPGLRRLGHPRRLPGSYQGVPTPPGAGLAPAA